MTHLIPSKARKQRNSSAEVRDYRPLARGPQAQNPGNHPILFYKISHTKHFALIPCRLPDCAPTHCSPSSPALGKRDRTKQPAASTPAPLQTAAGTADRPEQKFFQGWMGARGKAGTVFTKNVPAFPRQTRPAPTFRHVPSLFFPPSLPGDQPAKKRKKGGMSRPCPASSPSRRQATEGTSQQKKRFTAPQGSGPARPVR